MPLPTSLYGAICSRRWMPFC